MHILDQYNEIWLAARGVERIENVVKNLLNKFLDKTCRWSDTVMP